MGRLAAVVAVALACAGVALAGDGKPQEKHTPADMAKARSIVLRAADVGAGWKGTRTTSIGATPRCKGFAPDQSDLVQTGDADSPDFEKGYRYVGSSASVFKTAAQAQASWNRIVRPGLIECLGSLFSKGLTSATVTTKVVSAGSLPFPRLAARTAAYRIVFTAKSASGQVRGAVDLVLLGQGRVDCLMVSVSFGSPPLAEEQRFARAMARRL